MGIYYVVSSVNPYSKVIEIKVTDNKRGYNVLMEFSAKNYNEALNKIRFSKSLNGDTHFL